MEQLRAQIDSLTQELDRLKRQSYIIEKGIKIFHDKISEVGGDKLRVQKSKQIILKSK